MQERLFSGWGPAVVGLLAASCVLPSLAVAQGRAAFAHDRDIATRFGRVIPEWGGSELVGIEYNRSKTPMVYAVDREGRREEIWLDLPGAETIYVHFATGGSNGAIAVVGYAQNPDPRAGHFLIWISPDRKRRTVIRLDPYGADRVALAGDGTIWTVGGMADALRPEEAKLNIFKRYDTSGKELASFHVRARGGLGIAFEASPMSYLMASRDRVGWFTNAGEYIEFSLDGTELARFEGPPDLDFDQVSGVGLDAENRLFVGRKGDEKFNFEVLELDRSTGGWRKAAVTGPTTPHWARILGFDGTTLITMEQADTLSLYKRAKEPESGQ